MTRLLRVELRRLFSRGLVVLAMVVGLAVSGLVLAATWSSVQPMSATETAQAERFYEQAREDWEENGEQQTADCLEQQAQEEEATGQDLDFGCDQMEPRREWFFATASPFHETLPPLLAGLAVLLLLLALAIGTTSTAAELSTGAIGTWLTFEPRRMRVYASKVAAAALGVVPVTILILAVVIAGAWLINDSQALTGGMTSQDWSEAAWTAARILALAVLGAVVGAALGFALRHTAAVLGVVIGYGVVVEGILVSSLPHLAPWTVMTNVSGWTTAGTTYWASECTADAMGTSCEMTEHALAFGHSAAYVLVGTALVVAVAALLFRRRDVG